MLNYVFYLNFIVLSISIILFPQSSLGNILLIAVILIACDWLRDCKPKVVGNLNNIHIYIKLVTFVLLLTITFQVKRRNVLSS